MPQYRARRRLERQAEAKIRQESYNRYIDELLLGSTTDVAQRKFLSLSPSQQRRIFADPRFAKLGWLVRLEVTHGQV